MCSSDLVALYALSSQDTSLCGSAHVIKKKTSTDTSGCSGGLFRKGDGYYCCACKDSTLEYDTDQKQCVCKDRSQDRSSGKCLPSAPPSTQRGNCICGYEKSSKNSSFVVKTSVENAVHKTCDDLCKSKRGFDYKRRCDSNTYTTWDDATQTCKCNLSGAVSTKPNSLLAMRGKLMCWCLNKKKHICPHVGIQTQSDANRCQNLC